jgi:hypothetical protein
MTVTPDRAVAEAYPTIFDLRATHTSLLTQYRKGGAIEEMAGDVSLFVERARRTGAYLDVEEQRVAAQGLIDYWNTTLYRASLRPSDAVLADFDSSLAPTLDDADCPYVGLEAFREKDSRHFFGRAERIEVMLGFLRTRRFVAVVGPSGSGKSSIVLGGVLPKLKAGAIEGSSAWRYLPSFVPGSEPLKNLAASLVREGGPPVDTIASKFLTDPKALSGIASAEGTPFVVAIDQFEEIFTLCEDLAARTAFAKNLVSLVTSDGGHVIVTMRSDYESRLATLPDLQELFRTADVHATPLGAAELREAIEKPAELINLKLEAGLVDALVKDVLGEPTALPLLQFTLWKLWQARDHNRLTMDAYRRLGGGRAALANSADELFKSLSVQAQDTLRRILLRMVRPATGSEVTSSRVRVSALLKIGDDPTRVQDVLDRLVAARLVRRTKGETPDDDQVEVAHEALIRNWPLLVSWLEKKSAELIELRRYEVLAAEWRRFDHRSGFLDQEQVREAEVWLHSDEAKDIVAKDSPLHAFVAASRALHERERRKRRGVLAMLVVLVVVLIVALFVAWSSQREATEAERTKRLALEAAARHEADVQKTSAAKVLAAQQERASADLAVQKKLALADLAAEKKYSEQLERALKETMRAREAAEAAAAKLKRETANKDAALGKLLEEKEAKVRAEEAAKRALTAGIVVVDPIKARTGQIADAAHAGTRERQRPVRPGASIGDSDGSAATLCCAVRDAAGRVFFLTFAHFSRNPIGSKILQPALFDAKHVSDDTVIGTATQMGKDRYSSGLLIRPAMGVEFSPDVGSSGITWSGSTARVKPGDAMRMIGRGSGLTGGKVTRVTETTIYVDLPAEPGDSGAPVINENGDLVGMLWGSDKVTALVLPIDPILQELHVKLEAAR